MKLVTDNLKSIRFFDLVIIIFLIIMSFFPLFLFNYSIKDNDLANEHTAIISINGTKVKELLLSKKKEHQIFTLYPAKDQHNTIEIKGTKIRVKEDNSPDQVAVSTGWISKPGQTIICLPHKLIIEVKPSKNISDDSDLIIPL